MDRKKNRLGPQNGTGDQDLKKKVKNRQTGKMFSEAVEQVGGHRYPSGSSLCDLQQSYRKYRFEN